MGKGNKIPLYILELESQGWGDPGRVEGPWEITLCSWIWGWKSPEPGEGICPAHGNTTGKRQAPKP